MKIITLPFCFFMKFDSMKDLRTHIDSLKGMLEWSEEELEAGRLLGESGGRTIVETGTLRIEDNWEGDGYSTFIFGKYCSLTGAELYTIDIDPPTFTICKGVTMEFADHIHYIVGDSIEVLENFDKTVDLLYLDSLDFPWIEGVPTPEKLEEARLSQEHDLDEMKAAYGKLSPGAVVLVDDNLLPRGGKSKMTKAFLMEKGWNLVIDNYQALFVRSA